MGNLTKNTITRGAVVALALSAGAATTANAAVTRTSGADRYATATQIFNSWPTTPDTAILAAGVGHDVDALTVAPLAKMKNAPVILVDTKASAATIVAQFSAFKTVYIANGTGVISADVEAALKAANKTVVRLGGVDRTETALNIAKQIGAANGIVIANGDDSHLVDTLSIASIAAAKGMPIFLTSGGTLSAAEATYAKGLGATNVYALGGTTVVTDAAAAGLGTTVTRLAGPGRYETNAKVITNFKASLDLSNVYVASGEDANLIDALAGAPLAGLKNAPIVFAHDSVNADVNTLLGDILTSSTKINILGGTGAVTDAVKLSVAAIQDAKNPNLVVSSITPVNAVQVKVVFSKAVNAGATGTNAENPANYLVGGNAPLTAVLQADGKTVLLTLATANALTNGASTVYVVNAVASSADTSVTSPAYATSQSFTDTTAPTVASVASTTNGTTADTVKVTFSEPVYTGTIKIDGVGYSVTAGSTTTTITGLSLDATKSHTLEVVNLKDYGYDGTTHYLNNTAYSSQTFNITVDKNLPTATVSAYGDKAILVTFSKPVNDATIDSVAAGAFNITVKDELLANVNVTKIAKASTDTDGTKYVVTIDPTVSLYSSLTSRNLTLLFSANIKDSVGTGNSFAAVTKTITLTKDTTAPTVTDISFTKNSDGTLKDVTVTYSKGLKLQTIANTALTVVDANGLLQNAKFNSASVAANDTKVVFTAVANYTPTSVLTFTAPTVVDNSETGNSSIAFSKNLNINSAASATTFTVVPTIAQLIDKNKITVDFGSNVVKGGAVAGSATDPSNYSINNKVLPAGTVIYLEAGQMKADITLPDGFITADDTNAVVRINNVQTTSGLTIVPVVTTANLKENGKPVLTSAVLNGDGTITAGFSEAFTTFAKAELSIVINGSSSLNAADYTATLITSGADKGKYLIVVNALADGTGSYIDVDNSTGFNTGDIRVVALGSAGAVDLKGATAISTITVGTVSAPATSVDANGNILKASTTLTVK